MRSSLRFTRLINELNKTNAILTAKQWSELILDQDPTSSDILITQSYLNLLYFLGNVLKIARFKGKSPRYSYKRDVSEIKVRETI